jgi:hypothetical protein
VARKLMLLLILAMSGCTVSTGFYVEKDWQTDTMYVNPDLRTQWKIEATREFKKGERWLY